MDLKRNRALIAALVIGLLLSGCSLPNYVRKDSEILGLYVDSVKQQTAEFKAGRNAIDKARMRNVTFIEDSALRAEQRTQRYRQEWEITQSKERLALFDGIRKGLDLALQQRKELADMRQASDKAVAATTSAVSFRQDKLAETSAGLVKLSEQRDGKEEITFYKGFFGQVAQNLRAAKERASDAAKSAEENTDAKKDQKAAE